MHFKTQDQKFKAKKKFGQHFLINEFVFEKIKSAVSFYCPLDITICEIGPGYGSLTKHLLENNRKICVFEIDNDCVEFLQEKYIDFINSNHLQIHCADILHTNLSSDYVVGNLPYNIGAKILEKIIYNPVKFAMFMLQKEVALRTYFTPCGLNFFINARYDVIKLMDVGRSSFEPAPKVDSQIIMLKLHNRYPNLDCKKLSNILRIIFNQPRKKISCLKFSAPHLFAHLKEYEHLRPENLPKEIIYELAQNKDCA